MVNGCRKREDLGGAAAVIVATKTHVEMSVTSSSLKVYGLGYNVCVRELGLPPSAESRTATYRVHGSYDS